MKTKAIRKEPIEKATDIQWQTWLELIEQAGGKNMSHPEIVAVAYRKLNKKIDKAGWWSQGIAVAYEQQIGRRLPGQKPDGTFEFSVSKTFDGQRKDIFEKVSRILDSKTKLNNGDVKNTRTTSTPNRSHWRCDLDDTKLDFSFEQRPKNKTAVIIYHTQLKNQSTSDEWRNFWKQYVAKELSCNLLS